MATKPVERPAKRVPLLRNGKPDGVMLVPVDKNGKPAMDRARCKAAAEFNGYTLAPEV